MQGRRTWLVSGIIALVAVLFIGLPAHARDYVITSGDSLNIKVVGEPDYSRSFTVNDEGNIFVPNIGNVVATGKTADELKAELTKKLSDLIKNPVVTVEITSPTNTTVLVSGEVKTPGDVKLKADYRLMDVIQKAGGFTDNADRAKAVILRKGETQPRVVDLDALFRGDMTKNELMETGDTLYVPPKAQGKVKILGEVTTPGEKDFKLKLTPMEAVTLAGGFKDNADKSAVVIQHKDGTQVTVDLDAEARGEDSPLTKNLYLTEDDTVMVPNNKNNQVIVLGAGVKTPGTFGYEPGMTVSDALTKAGGFVERARTKDIKIIHKKGTPASVNYEQFINKGDVTQNIPLERGDTVTVGQDPVKERRNSGLEGAMGTILPTITSILLYKALYRH
ncbi:MAG TPA: SLBB domain-containing protein [Armatimonadota bacterium]|jgi:polysaccharide export outer membrane protein